MTAALRPFIQLTELPEHILLYRALRRGKPTREKSSQSTSAPEELEALLSLCGTEAAQRGDRSPVPAGAFRPLPTPLRAGAPLGAAPRRAGRGRHNRQPPVFVTGYLNVRCQSPRTSYAAAGAPRIMGAAAGPRRPAPPSPAPPAPNLLLCSAAPPAGSPLLSARGHTHATRPPGTGFRPSPGEQNPRRAAAPGAQPPRPGAEPRGRVPHAAATLGTGARGRSRRRSLARRARGRHRAGSDPTAGRRAAGPGGAAAIVRRPVPGGGCPPRRLAPPPPPPSRAPPLPAARRRLPAVEPVLADVALDHEATHVVGLPTHAVHGGGGGRRRSGHL